MKLSSPTLARAPNRRPRFAFARLIPFDYLFCAPSASLAAVGEARRGPLLMNIYITDSQIPELKDVPPNVARKVLLLAERLMHSDTKLLTELPVFLCAVGCPTGSFVAGWAVCLLGLAQPHSGELMSACLVGTGAGGLLGGFVGRQIRIPSLRRYVRNAIDQLTSSIVKAA